MCSEVEVVVVVGDVAAVDNNSAGDVDVNVVEDTDASGLTDLIIVLAAVVIFVSAHSVAGTATLFPAVAVVV